MHVSGGGGWRQMFIIYSPKVLERFHELGGNEWD
jgi:hypothetical protein